MEDSNASRVEWVIRTMKEKMKYVKQLFGIMLFQPAVLVSGLLLLDDISIILVNLCPGILLLSFSDLKTYFFNSHPEEFILLFTVSAPNAFM